MSDPYQEWDHLYQGWYAAFLEGGLPRACVAAYKQGLKDANKKGNEDEVHDQ